jgi:hypothetical protein
MNWDRCMGFAWGWCAGSCCILGAEAYFLVAGNQWVTFAILAVIATVANFVFGSSKTDAKDTARADRPEF